MSNCESFGKDQLNDLIENAVRSKCPFETVLSQINDKTKLLKLSISEYDKVYIEKKYRDLLIELWLREVPELIELAKPNDIVKGINLIKSVQHFDDCSKISNKSQYNNLICHFSQISKILKSQEKSCIITLKKACFNKISQHADFLKCEQSFFEHILKVLKLHTDPNELCSEIHLTYVLNDPGESSFKQFLTNLQNQETHNLQILALKHYAHDLLNLDHYFLLADQKRIIKCYLQEASITQLVIDGRDILEVSGKHIVLSKLISKVEKHPSFSQIDEVRFVKADAIHIDVDLAYSVWHGKNIVIYASSIIVNKSRHLFWNISGLDGSKITDFQTLAPHSSRDTNLSGNPGESGGNVMIIAENVYNGQFLKIISNGGNGTNGMDGTRGQDGKDGASISNMEFKNEFPPVSKLSNVEKQSRLKTTYDSVLKRLKYVEECYVGNVYYDRIANWLFKTLLDDHIIEMGNIYFEAIMTNGCKVTFSFYNSGMFTFCQSFLLFNGSTGSEGNSGTNGGDGGNCGFAGDINIYIKQNSTASIITRSNDGTPGKRGKPGENGKSGKCGLDKAYIDHTNLTTGQWPELFLPTKNDSYILEARYKSFKEGKCVYAFHKNEYVNISQCNKDARKQFSFNKSWSKQESSWQHSSNTNRKKTICLESIVEKYGSLNGGGLDDECDFTLDAFKDILNDITTEALEVEEVVDETSVKRIFTAASRLKSHMFEYRDWFKQKIVTTYNESQPLKKTLVCAAESIKLIEESPTNICHWLNLFKSGLDFKAMCHMWTTADRLFIEQNINVIQSQEIKELLIGKLKLMTLEFVNSKIPIDSKSGQSKMKPSLEVRNVLSLTSNVCQAAVKFLCEDTHEMRMTVRDLCENSHQEFYFVEVLKTFIVEYSESFQEYKDISQLLTKKFHFHQQKQYQLELKLQPIKNMLTSSRHLSQDNIRELLKKNAYGDTNSQICLDKAITSSDDMFLKHCYMIYCTEVRTHFDWNDLEDIKEKLRSLFILHVEHSGPLMKSYRDFLAYYLDVNILIYVPVQSEAKLVLVDNHNPKGKKTIYFLKKDNTFLFLDVDNDDGHKNKAHLEIDEIRNKIIVNVDSFSDVKEFFDFQTSSPFMSAGYEIQDKSAALRMEVKNILAQNFNLQTLKYMFNADESVLILNKWIDKLTLCNIGNSSILHFMILHFYTEGKLIPAIELSFVLSFLLKLSFESSNLLSKLTWIIASCPQKVWLVEITLLNLDLCLEQAITPEEMCKWRNYLNDLEDKTTLMLLLEKLSLEKLSGRSVNITTKWIEEVLFLSSNIPKSHIGLLDIDLCDWKYYLKDKFWACQLLKVTDWLENDLKSVCYFMLLLENLLSMNMCMKIVDAARKHKNISLSDKIEIKDTLRVLCNGEISVSEKLIENLSSMSICHWKNVLKNHQKLGEERQTPQIINIINESGNTSKLILNILPDVAKAIDLTKKIEKKLREQITTKDALNNWIEHLIRLIPSTSENYGSLFKKIGSLIDKFNYNSAKFIKSIELLIKQSFEGSIKSSLLPHSDSNASFSIESPKTENVEYMLVATVFVAIDLVLGIQLRDTQLITILIFLIANNNVLGQVSTGEGKSIIIVAIAIISALLRGYQVDIITSSHVLAERDAKKYNELYKTFNLSAGHNSYSDMEERKKNYSNCQIVYGELASFQRDYLLDRFYSKNIMGDRKLKLVIVDEVDSMLLDQSSNMLYLSHNIPDLDKLQPVFVFIWKMLNLPELINRQVPTAQDIKETILFDVFGCINKNNIKTLDSNFTNQQVQSTWEYLIDKGVLSKNGEFLVNEIEEAIFETLPTSTCISEDHLRFLMNKIVSRQKEIIIPNHLKYFVTSHVEIWIQSAMRAKSMEINKHYVVDIDRSSYKHDCNPNIVILDHDTGNDLVNSQWDEGLHQFLQLKHGCKLSLLSLKAVFISNVSYIKLYSNLNGLSGTLGSQSERELLKEVYNVEFVTIPTANPKIFIEYPPLVCPNSRIWLNTIIKEVTKLLPKRSALIICESVSDVNLLEDEFKKCFTAERFGQVVSSYKRDYQVLGGANNLKPGLIILSTNLAGRGTDIKPSEDLVKAGGLHVCLSFLPSNCRIEEQALGRVARNGVPGTAQLIFKNLIQSSSISVVIDVKKQRDCFENLRIQEIKTYYESKIKVEEENFEEFKIGYEQLKSKMSHHKEEVKSILLKECLDQWAFWLDCNSYQLNKVSIEDFLLNLSVIGVKDEHTWYLGIKNPSNLLKLGLFFLQNNDLKCAHLCFGKVLADEPDFSGIARYYSVVATFKDASTINKEKVIYELLGSKKQFEAHIHSLLVDINVVENLSIHSRGILEYEFFKEQQESIIKIYTIHIQAIDIILGANADYTLMGYENILIDLTKKGIILKYKPCSLLTENNLFFVTKYGLDPKKLILFLKGHMEAKLDFKSLVDTFSLPSRELFWDQLLANQILIDETKYIIFDLEGLKKVDPSLERKLRQLQTNDNQCVESANNEIWIYQSHELPNKFSKTALKVDFLTEVIGVGLDRLKYLEEREVIVYNRKATLKQRSLNQGTLSFDSICCETFRAICVNPELANEILDELKLMGFLTEKLVANKKVYSLATNKIDDLEDMQLVRFKGYSEDVKWLLNYHFSFRLALEDIIQKSESNKHVTLHLDINPHKRLEYDLVDSGIIKTVVSNQPYDKIFEKIFSKTDIECWEELFDKVYNKTERCEIVRALIVIKVFIPTGKNMHYKINTDDKGKIIWPGGTKPHIINEQNETIQLILKEHLNKPKEFIRQRLRESRGLINHECNSNFSFHLTPLVDRLQDQECPTTEIALMSLNGFDQVLNFGEEKWTRKMITNVALASMLGIGQIGAGIALSSFALTALFGEKLAMEGVTDLVYCATCATIGIFSWKNYLFNKAVSIAMSFGQMLVGKMFNSFKNKVSTSESGNKFSEQELLQYSTSTPNALTEINTKEVIKRLSVNAAKSLSIGVACNTLPHLIERQCKQISIFLVEMFKFGIDETLEHHPINECINQMCTILGEEVCMGIIRKKLDETLYECRSNSNSLLSVTISNTIAALSEALSITLPILREQDSIELVSLGKLAFSLTDLIKNGGKYQELKNIPGMLVNQLHEKLVMELSVTHSDTNMVSSHTSKYQSIKTEISSQTINKLQIIVKTDLAKYLHDNVVFPFITSAGDIISKHCCKQFLCGIDLDKHLKLNRYDYTTQIFKNEELDSSIRLNREVVEKSVYSKESTVGYTFLELEYDKILMMIFKKTRNLQLFAEIIHKNVVPDENVFRMFCVIIPDVLNIVGVNIPPLEIVTYHCGICEKYTAIKNEISLTTVNISSDDSIHVQDILEAICKTISETCPRFKWKASEMLQHILCYIENYSTKCKDKSSNVHLFYPKQKIDQSLIPTISKGASDYKQLHPKGRWDFNPVLDVDLREENTCTYGSTPSTSPVSLLTGFNIALTKINHHIYKHQKHLGPPFKLSLEQFDVLDVTITTPTTSDPKTPFQCQPVHYEVVMPFTVSDGTTLEDFKVSLKLKCNRKHAQPYSPQGVYIVYEIEPVHIRSDTFIIGVKGHILLSNKIKSLEYTTEDCYATGELILPSNLTISDDLTPLISLVESKKYKVPSKSKCRRKRKRKQRNNLCR